jgi:uncharacterized protein (UPF0335 family)
VIPAREVERLSQILEEERRAAAEERRESVERVERVRGEGAEAAAQVRQQANEALGQAWEELQHVESLLTNAQQQVCWQSLLTADLTFPGGNKHNVGD